MRHVCVRICVSPAGCVSLVSASPTIRLSKYTHTHTHTSRRRFRVVRSYTALHQQSAACPVSGWLKLLPHCVSAGVLSKISAAMTIMPPRAWHMQCVCGPASATRLAMAAGCHQDVSFVGLAGANELQLMRLEWRCTTTAATVSSPPRKHSITRARTHTHNLRASGQGCTI